MIDALRLAVHFGDSHVAGPELLSDALMDRCAQHRIAVSALLRGTEGFGLGRRIHAERFPDSSTDLPLVAVAVDARARIESLLADVDALVAGGLVTIERMRLAGGEAVGGLEAPPGPGHAAMLTVYCGRAERARSGAPAHREVVELLRRHGASGATVLLGLDGTLHGVRRRATILSPRRDAPMVVVSVGERRRLEASLADVARSLADPLVALERVSLLKHDGEPLEDPPPSPAAEAAQAGPWQALRLYTRESSQVGGRTLHGELVRRLREGGAAGATTVRGHWGFSSDERPHGDRFARLASHAPSVTTCIDRRDRIAALWPAIDELTAEHGIVTLQPVPVYQERHGARRVGELRVPAAASG